MNALALVILLKNRYSDFTDEIYFGAIFLSDSNTVTYKIIQICESNALTLIGASPA